MKTTISNRQSRFTFNARALKGLTAFLARVLHRGELPWGELTLIFTDNAGISSYKRACFRRDEVTDVISCTYAPMPGEALAGSCELIVNAERADDVGSGGIRARLPAGWTASHELALYIAHGIDHAAGHDDDTPGRRAAMRRRELAALAAAGQAGLLAQPLMSPRRSPKGRRPA